MQLSQNRKTVIVVTNKLDIIKSSDFIIHLKDGDLEGGTYNKLLSESSKFRSFIERSESDKIIIDFEPGVPDVKNYFYSNKIKQGPDFSRDEMIQNEVAITRISKNNTYSSTYDNEKEVILYK